MIKAAPSEVGSTGMDLSLGLVSVLPKIRKSYVNRRIRQVSVLFSPCPVDEARVTQEGYLRGSKIVGRTLAKRGR
ncbi:hypothetical protein K469DRAFT_714210 [Zopfia rhizophila CBS 207.26]|uniref:Uncharacterized protein n=1 Tax=Zopfia rhizophila CBS 207.26 TaxID=1314779 RepID=A0A6A6DRV9_9PEZI|nr:hypothetical protein K469DRAFT_714210 [Zopfia rhizophila CBS 207.26]